MHAEGPTYATSSELGPWQSRKQACKALLEREGWPGVAPSSTCIDIDTALCSAIRMLERVCWIDHVDDDDVVFAPHPLLPPLAFAC